MCPCLPILASCVAGHFCDVSGQNDMGLPSQPIIRHPVRPHSTLILTSRARAGPSMLFAMRFSTSVERSKGEMRLLQIYAFQMRPNSRWKVWMYLAESVDEHESGVRHPGTERTSRERR